MKTIDYAVKHNYILSPAQVGELAREYVSALKTATTIGGTTYLRVLIAGTQQTLGNTPRLRAVRAALAPLNEDSKTRQLNALEEVHSQYYAAILDAVVDDSIKDSVRLGKDERSRRAKERNVRTNFARSAKSTIAAYIKAGHDITGLAVTSVTKQALYQASNTGSEKPKLVVLTRQLDRNAARVTDIAKELLAADGDTAKDRLTALLADLTALIVQTGVKPVMDAKAAQDHCVPLQTKVGVFWPVGPESIQ